MKTGKKPSAKKREQVIRLEDLAPRKDIIGGAGKLLFGERIEPRDEPARPPEAPPEPKNKS